MTLVENALNFFVLEYLVYIKEGSFVIHGYLFEPLVHGKVY